MNPRLINNFRRRVQEEQAEISGGLCSNPPLDMPGKLGLQAGIWQGLEKALDILSECIRDVEEE